MKHYLVDTNVIIDLLLNREGADAAAALLDGVVTCMHIDSLFVKRANIHISNVGHKFYRTNLCA